MPSNEVSKQSDGEESKQPNIFRRTYDRIYKKWNDADRPGIFAFHYYYLPAYLPVALIAGGFAVAVSDEVLGTHFAEDMANVQVMPDSAWPVRLGQAAIQCVGIEAGAETANECIVFDVLWGDK